MNDFTMNNTKGVGLAEICAKIVPDALGEKEFVLSFAPTDGYKKKLDLIFAAEDMSTIEKIEAIERTEEQRATDLRNGVNTYKSIVWNRYLLVFSCVAGAIILASTPEGNKVLRTVFKCVA